MFKTKARGTKLLVAPVVSFLMGGAGAFEIPAQSLRPAVRAPLPLDEPVVPHRTRLILKDGSFQVVMSYRQVGANIVYVSAERGGNEEMIPVSLVDLDATRKWEQGHTAPPEGSPAPAIDPELLREEADRAAYTPQVAPDLNLPEQDSVLALDTFQGTPELIPLPQSAGELNRNTAHNILKGAINPMSAAHRIVDIRGTRASVQLHVSDPVFFLRIGEASPASGGGFTVDTHGANGQAPSASAGGVPGSRYVLLRADVRTDSRILTSFQPAQLAGGRRQEDVTELAAELLPGGHWMKLTTREPLLFGEYALMEVLSDREVNLGVWDFGIHPVAPENRDAIKPEAKRPISLERRRPQ